jgi:hypothetical protein
MFELPKCRHCGRQWKPRLGVVADHSFCSRCKNDRREIAKQNLDLRPLRETDFDGPYLLPRRLRKSG